MKKILILLILICLLPLNRIIAQETEYKSINDEWTLNTNGTQVFHHVAVLHLKTVTDMRNFGEDFIIYNPENQVLKVNYCYTIQEDGNRVDTPENGYVDVLPSNAQKAPAYNNLREKVIIHTGLDENCTVYLDYTLTSKPGYNTSLDICKPLRQKCPVKKYTLSVSAPSNISLNYNVKGNRKTKFITSKSNGLTTASCTFNNLPAKIVSDYNSYTTDGEDYFIASTYSNQTEAFSRLSNHIIKDNNSQLKILAKSLTSNSNNESQAIDALLKYVKEDTQTCKLNLSETNYQVRNANDVIKSAYGTQIEKLNLLKGLINSFDSKFNAQICVSYLPNSKGITNLNGILNMFIIISDNGEQKILSISSNPKMLSWNNQFLPAISLKTLKEVKLNKCESLAQHFDVTPNIKECKEGILLVPLQYTSQERSIKSLCQKISSTKKDVLLTFPITNSKVEYTVNIPKEMKLISSTKTETKSNKMGTVTTKITKQNDKILINRTLELSNLVQPIINQKDFSDFHDLMLEWISINQHTLIFSK